MAPSFLIDPMPPIGLARPDDIALPSLVAVPTSFAPAAAILAVKPQMADAVMASLGRILQPGAVVLSIMAGRDIAGIAEAVGGVTPVVRAMPNTPASIGQGMTVACAGLGVTQAQHELSDALLSAVGDVAWVDDETLMDPITAVSGSGPAYLFLLAELLEQAAMEQGVPPALARRLARKTVSGAGALLGNSNEDAADLRRAVTSPGGTTEAALAVLMDETAWPQAVAMAVRAGVARARELAS